MSGQRPVVMHAVGDIALGDHPLCAGFGTHSRSRSRPPAFLFEQVSGLLKRADLRFGNLECTISERGKRANDFHSVQMRGWPEYLKGIVSSGFEVLNVANNHSMQHGREPFIETLSMLQQAGVKVCGVDGESGTKPVTISVHDLRLVFLGYSLRPRQYFTAPPLYAEGSHDGMLADIRSVRKDNDIVIVSLHWGDEFIQRPSPVEVQQARELIDGGADLIVGHHPHVLRGVERHGRGWIVYSLGNFVCDMIWAEPLRETAICECVLTASGVESVKLIPARINDDYQPVLLSGASAQRLDEKIRQMSDGLASVNSSAAGLADYQKAAEHELDNQRAQSHRYFLKNSYRFPPRILAAQLATYVRNRFSELGLSKRQA